MNVLDLFSGIGGFSLGLQRAGMKTIAFCEIDKYCQKVLKKNFPDIPIYDDVCKLNGSDINEPVDLICGGFPCQPFSVAGKRLGAADDRHLWPEYLRLIQEFKPTWIIGENVAGLINMGLDNVLSDLEGAGYSSRTFVIPAVAVDAKHRRDRLWIVAHSNLQHDKRRGQPCKPISSGREPWTELNGGRSNVAYADSAYSERNECTERSIEKNTHSSEPCRWKIEPSMGRVANGIPHRMDRLKGLGNAVVPQIPEIIGNAIMEVSRS
jgi:DNA (cytosine-5)-methyltransferase 1